MPFSLKRSFDVLASLCMLVFLAPLFAFLSWRIRREMGSPVLFRQLRPGLHGKPFTMFKFRSMSAAKDASGRLLPDKERLTPFGERLRRSSLDELPELINIARGEMSFVGPRPLLMQYLPRYSPQQRRRHEVLPGLTGWAQVHGRNALTWEEKFQHDIWYVENHNFLLDIYILWLTVRLVWRREGTGPMEEFYG